MSGAEMIAAIRKRPELDDTPILILTWNSDEKATMDLLEQGAQDFIARPFSVNEMFVRVRNLIRVRQAHVREH